VSKKSAKKNGKKFPYTCLACGKGMKRSHPACRRCGHRNPGFSPKVAAPPAFIVKAVGGKVTPITAAKVARPVCHCGHQGRRTDKCCTRCGAPYGISKAVHEGGILKAAGVIPSGYWADKAVRESDPAQREVLRGMAVKSARPASAEALARAWGFSSLRDAAMYCIVPEARSYFMNAYYGSNGGQSA
jgi:hypothetical protein